MIRLEIKNNNMIVTEKQPKYQLYYETELVNMNILQEKKQYHQIKNKYKNELNLLILL